ncbi:hypothetical protein ANANG_G00269490 [Anguilla anguilla]|uniref:Ig-like domain-containing protein n=1 Tax=Anguilla anguilla TaxID=7936 RepID=A0A9D3LQQ1_ANGAN|nr:hypothetical protein ANANG_G00269490 [Anguilla anguilla]
MSKGVSSYKGASLCLSVCLSVCLSDSITGELHISNHSEALSGMYRCEASNAVGKEHCRYTLRAEKPPSRAGVIAGTVIGVLLLLLILVLLIFLLICRYGKRCKDKEVANDIREDSPPPVSRPHSRISSFRPGVAYTSVQSPQPWGSQSSAVTSQTPANSKPRPPSARGTRKHLRQQIRAPCLSTGAWAGGGGEGGSWTHLRQQIRAPHLKDGNAAMRVLHSVTVSLSCRFVTRVVWRSEVKASDGGNT